MKKINKLLISYNKEQQQQHEQESISNKYNNDIINQLIEFEIGTKEEIINAMNMVTNHNDINEIVDYITSKNNIVVDNKDTHDDDDENDNKLNEEKDENISDSLQILMSMGYDINCAKLALEISENNIEIAVQYLIDGLLNINKPIVNL